MKKRVIFLSFLMMGLCACAASAADASGDASDTGGGDTHFYFEGDNIVEHEIMGYCGNTVTTVCKIGGESVSFWGTNSVALTDLLLYLDYSEDTCRCPAEYRVDTEFGEGYEINLTNTFVRHDGKQVSLTEEQAEQVREILENPLEEDVLRGKLS